MRWKVVIFSLVMPGLGQWLNKQYLKSIFFICIEHILNRLAYINKALYFDLNGLHEEALSIVNVEYAMFYPGIYVLCALDSLLHVKETNNSVFLYWFALAGLLGTVGVIYARFVPVPVFSVGLMMVIFILIGTFHCTKINHSTELT
ncbi:hypothetical protein [Radiobacillus deserti]|uniref:Uncharacterized protein n=1 Tax=Radiobacillus deserti TaxID=2594883 RepID=A0A516KEB2_9BACI|nr:hypothetical protein [Radiobacillus deserti]QDP39656.1 hypothetical protein FN924_05365 [Radiobacillus deserti]